jgi:hypothetical protein
MKGYIFIICLFLTACVAKKQSAEFEAQPAWMKQKPIIPGYYIGIGSAKKVGTSSEYIANARKDALADLAGEVSTQINATSVYRTIENKYGFIESYDQRIETTVEDYLEGFEPVEFYENNDSYWAYFRISRETYLEKKELKKKEALMAALSKYNSGLQEEMATNPKEALTFYLQGLLAIKPYLKEETSVVENGNKTDVGNQLFSAMDNVLANLKIVAEKQEIQIKSGESSNQSIQFRVLYKELPARGIPVEVSYSGGYLKNDRQNSDGNGWVYVNPDAIFSKNKREQFTATINLKEIASKAVEDTFIRGLMLKRNLQPAVIKVNVEPAVIALKIEDNSCEGAECTRLNQVFNQNVVRAGYSYIEGPASDFTFTLSYNITPGASAGGLFSMDLKGEIKLMDVSNKTVWSKNINGIRGVGKDGNEAKEKALTELITMLDRNYIRQGLDNIVSGY